MVLKSRDTSISILLAANTSAEREVRPTSPRASGNLTRVQARWGDALHSERSAGHSAHQQRPNRTVRPAQAIRRGEGPSQARGRKGTQRQKGTGGPPRERPGVGTGARQTQPDLGVILGWEVHQPAGNKCAATRVAERRELGAVLKEVPTTGGPARVSHATRKPAGGAQLAPERKTPTSQASWAPRAKGLPG